MMIGNYEGSVLATSTLKTDFETFITQIVSHLSQEIELCVIRAITNTKSEEPRKCNCQNNTDLSSEFITRNEALEYLRISAPTLHRYQKEGLLPYYKVGRKVYFKTNELVIATKVVSKEKVKSRKGAKDDR